MRQNLEFTMAVEASGKNVFITGGTSGIGLALAKLYAQDGWRVGICGRDLKKLPDLRAWPLIFSYQVDVTNLAALRQAVQNFAPAGVDLMIANAGISMGDKQPLPNFAGIREILAINVGGTLNALEVALEKMLPQKKGHLVLTASVAGMVGLPSAAAYSASKAYLLKLGESLSLDLKDFGITVTTIAPGFIDTPLTRKNKHRMPFMLTVEQGAAAYKKAIGQGKSFYIFPWKMRWLMMFLERMPRCCYRAIMRVAAPIFYRKTK